MGEFKHWRARLVFGWVTRLVCQLQGIVFRMRLKTKAHFLPCHTFVCLSVFLYVCLSSIIISATTAPRTMKAGQQSDKSNSVWLKQIFSVMTSQNGGRGWYHKKLLRAITPDRIVRSTHTVYHFSLQFQKCILMFESDQNTLKCNQKDY